MVYYRGLIETDLKSFHGPLERHERPITQMCVITYDQLSVHYHLNLVQVAIK